MKLETLEFVYFYVSEGERDPEGNVQYETAGVDAVRALQLGHAE